MKPFLSVVAVILAGTSAWGQGTAVEKGGGAQTLKVQLSGDDSLRFIIRGADVAQWRSGGAGNSETEFSPNIWVRIDAELADKVGARIEMGMDPLRDIGSADVPQMGEVYIKMSELLSQNVTLKFGQVRDAFEVRPGEGSLVYDSFWSEDPSYSQGLDGRSFTGAYAYSAGAVLDYAGDGFSIHAALLPKINDAGDPSPASADESIAAVSASINLPFVSKNSRFSGVACALSSGGPGEQVNIWGGGVNLFLAEDDSIEVFGHAYGNTGSAGTKIDARGMAFEGGAKLTFSGDNKPWLQAKFTFLSGDSDSTDNENENYISREHQTDLMILEDEVMGVDWDSNYQAVKISGGISFKVGQATTPNVDVMVTAGLAQTVEDLGNENVLGNEIDAKITYRTSPGVSLEVGGAFLTGSDILGQSTVKGDDSGSLGWFGTTLKW